jgi:cold shock CspA family protein
VNFEGVVAVFDEDRGDGIVRDDQGREFYFHCVNIADGTRRIDVGTRVRAARVVGLRGRDEAADVVKL